MVVCKSVCECLPVRLSADKVWMAVIGSGVWLPTLCTFSFSSTSVPACPPPPSPPLPPAAAVGGRGPAPGPGPGPGLGPGSGIGAVSGRGLQRTALVWSVEDLSGP